MTLRTWLSAALVVSLVSLTAAPSFADSRSAAHAIAQARPGRAGRVEPAPAPARAKQARLDPKPAPDAARQAGRANSTHRTGRGR